MNSDFVASKSNIFEIFNFNKDKELNQDKYLDYKVNIPPFQRKYSWEKKDIEGLLEELDIIRDQINEGLSFDINNIYLGHAIFEIKEGKSIEIIDGQQRLTTFLLLFKILEERYIEANEDKKDNERLNLIRSYLYLDYNVSLEPKFNHQDVNKKIINQYVYLNDDFIDTEEIYNCLKNSKNKTKYTNEKYSDDWFEEKSSRVKRDILNEYYKRKPSYKKDSYFNIVRNFNLLEDYIEECKLKDLKTLNEYVNSFKKFELSYIVTNTFEQAYDIFTSLNSKGKPLSDFDLIKSHCINRIINDKDESSEGANKIWRDYIEFSNISDKEITSLFDWYILVNKNDENLDDLKKVYERVKKFIENKDIDKFLKGINKYVVIYNRCIEGAFSKNFSEDLLVQEIEDYDNLVEMLMESSYIASKPYIFYLIDKMEHNKENIENMIDLALWLPVVYVSLFNNRPESLLRLIDKLNEDKKDEIDDKKSFINTYFKNYVDGVTEEKLIGELSKELSTRVSKYLLMLAEDNSKASKSKLLELEHIFPQKPNRRLREDLSKNKMFNSYYDEEIYKERLNKLGNLTLLNHKINNTIKNSNVEDKVKEYKKDQDNIKSLKDFLNKYIKNNESCFKFEDIDKRTTELAADFQRLIKEKDLY